MEIEGSITLQRITASRETAIDEPVGPRRVASVPHSENGVVDASRSWMPDR